MTNGEVLNSWKEIASYVGRGVRTVQRWERELGLPVRRPRGKQRSAVIGLKQDIDQWLRSPHVGHHHGGHPTTHHLNHAKLLRNAEVLKLRTSVLLAQSDILQKQIARAISIGTALRTACMTVRAKRKNWASTTTAVKDEIAPTMELGPGLQNPAAPISLSR